MKGVCFGSHHSSDYGLILSKKEIESPNPKLETVDLPGADGLLDMTDYFGDVKYENRQLKFEFSTFLHGKELSELYSRVQDDLNGRRFTGIVIDDDPDFRYIGRVTSVKLAEDKISRITVLCSCEPYKVRVKNKIISVNLNGLPFGSSYGDCNGDGVVDTLDSVKLIKIIENGAASSDDLSACDLNFDGKVDNDDLILLNGFLAQTGYTNIRDYAESLGYYRDTETTVDFGRKSVDVIFKVNVSGAGSSKWELYIDGAYYAESYVSTFTAVLTGSHRIMFKTSGKGTASIEFAESGL
ncbi:MAG: dockerin type I domain-containing protein [Porcipelethomonas sp.]